MCVYVCSCVCVCVCVCPCVLTGQLVRIHTTLEGHFELTGQEQCPANFDKILKV